MIDSERETKLREVQDMAVDHAIEEMTAAADLSLNTKEERGDRFWLTKMAGQSLTVAAKIESFIMLRNAKSFDNMPDEDDDAAADRMIKKARGEVSKIIEKARGGLPNREK